VERESRTWNQEEAVPIELPAPARQRSMALSYLFDPVQVPSPGYVNEVSSYKLEEDDTVKLKGTQSSEVLVQKNALPSGGLRRTESKGRTAGLPRQGPLPQEDTGGGHCVDKPGVSINGISPIAILQPNKNPKLQQGDGCSWVNTTDNIHPTQSFLEGEVIRKQDCALPTSEDTQVTQNGQSRAPSEAASPTLAIPDHVLHIPDPDYPQLWSPTVDSVDHEENCLSKNHPEGEPLAGTYPEVGEHGLNLPFPKKRSWDSLNKTVTTEALSVYSEEEGPAHAVPTVNSTNEQEGSHGSDGDREGEVEDEDAAVAEALAALEAATAGEDVDDAD
jgi:hypothetical protein